MNNGFILSKLYKKENSGKAAAEIIYFPKD